MSAPKSTMKITVMKRILSVLSRCAMFQILDQLFEDLPALLVILKLIEAGAGRGEQYDIAGTGVRRCFSDCARERAAGNQADRAFEMRCNFVGGRADQEHGVGLGAETLAHDCVVAAFIGAAENDPEVAI